MSPYTIPYPPQHTPTADISAAAFHPSIKRSRSGDRIASHAGSEDSSNYLHYQDAQKNEADQEEDPNASLTSQTLNADGTPKRPMNAFMIFARRRRPQVSAENQSMRTGEISKILSREWTTMGAIEKQFYLEQAKLLKDNFNSKYPDYVYRRRPNNSRRRRRTEGGANRQLENPMPNEADDVSGSDTVGEHSPAEGEDGLLDSALDIQCPRIAQNTFGEHSPFISPQQRSPTYPYAASEVAYRSVDSHDNRVPYMPAHERIPHERPSPSVNGSHYSPYMPQNHSQSSPQYQTEHSAGQGNWEANGENGRWVANHDRPLPPSSGPKSHQFPSPSSSPQWQTARSSAPINQPSTTTSHSSNYPFPTLNSPFYPSQSQLQGNFSGSPTSSSPHSASTTHYNSPNPQIQSGTPAGRQTSSYDMHSYTSTPSSNGFPPRDTHLYQQSQTRSSIVRPLAPLQTHPTFSHAHPVHVSSPAGFWARDS